MRKGCGPLALSRGGDDLCAAKGRDLSKWEVLHEDNHPGGAVRRARAGDALRMRRARRGRDSNCAGRRAAGRDRRSDGSPITRAYDLSIEGFYLVGSDTAELRISADGVDPAVAALYSNHDNTATALAELARDGETYLAATGVDSLATTGYESTMSA